jgi:hypothetical protein
MSHLHDGQYIFAIQKDMVLSNQLELIDFTYQQSQNQPFTVSTLTVPLWTNTVWSYLYHWYGQETYDYLPFWQGSDQINYVTKPLPTTTNPPTNHYFIMEPVFNNDPYQVSREQENQSSFSSLINQKVLKSLEVQHRKRL